MATQTNHGSQTVLRAQRGFTLAEMAIVLSIVGTILAAVWVAAANVQNANHANQAGQQIMQIAANVRASSVSLSTFPDLNTDEVANGKFIAANIIPYELIAGPTSAIDYWGGNVSVWENPGSVNARIFRVSFYGIPADACFRVASQLTSLNTNDGPVAMYTNSNGGAATVIPTTGVSSDVIQTACNLNTGGTPSLEFDFKIH